MGDVTVKVTGLAELQKKLEELATKDAKAIVRAGLMEMSAPILTEMKAGAPVYAGVDPSLPPGFLRDHLDRKAKFIKDFAAGFIWIGPQSVKDYPPPRPTKNKPALTRKGTVRSGMPVWAIANFMEFGWTDRTGHHHMGKPFIRPAWSKCKGKLLDILTNTIKSKLKL